MAQKKKSTTKRAKPRSSSKKNKTKIRKAARSAGSVAKKKKRATARVFSRKRAAPTGAQSGDLQGLSRRERADSESVDELLEEGNAFEAGVVAGVQEAEDSDEKEVRTREVLEDDVPGEYLDKDL